MSYRKNPRGKEKINSYKFRTLKTNTPEGVPLKLIDIGKNANSSMPITAKATLE